MSSNLGYFKTTLTMGTVMVVRLNISKTAFYYIGVIKGGFLYILGATKVLITATSVG